MDEDSPFERIPPQDVEAEQSVLGAMMLSKEAIADVISVLRATDFYLQHHETIFSTMLALHGRGEPVDSVTVANELRRNGDFERVGGGSYIHTLAAKVPTPASALYYANIVREQATLRGLVEAGTRIVQLGYSQDGGDVNDLVNAAQAELYRVSEKRTGDDYHPLKDLWSGVMDEIEAATKGPTIGSVQTGFTDFDEITRGLHPGQMIIIAARPAMGKSTLALDFCRHATMNPKVEQRKTAVIFSLEMSHSEIIKRMISAEANVPLSSINSGKVTSKDWDRMAMATTRMVEAPLFIDDSPNMSMPEIRSKCRRLKERHDLALVVIDYLQLMQSHKRSESRQQEVSEISRSLKLLAKELEIPVVAVAQLNRGPEQRTDRKPMMSDLRESGSLEQDADLIILLHRPEYYAEGDRPGEADIILAKHRNGTTGTIPVQFQGGYSRFRNLARDLGEGPGAPGGPAMGGPAMSGPGGGAGGAGGAGFGGPAVGGMPAGGPSPEPF